MSGDYNKRLRCKEGPNWSANCKYTTSGRKGHLSYQAIFSSQKGQLIRQVLLYIFNKHIIEAIALVFFFLIPILLVYYKSPGNIHK